MVICTPSAGLRRQTVGLAPAFHTVARLAMLAVVVASQGLQMVSNRWASGGTPRVIVLPHATLCGGVNGCGIQMLRWWPGFALPLVHTAVDRTGFTLANAALLTVCGWRTPFWATYDQLTPTCWSSAAAAADSPRHYARAWTFGGDRGRSSYAKSIDKACGEGLMPGGLAN